MKEEHMIELIFAGFAWLGLFCFFMAIGGAALFLKYCHDFAKEDKRRSQPTQLGKSKAIQEAEEIISRMF